MTLGRSSKVSNPRQIEILIALGRELAMSGGRRRYANVAKSVRSILQLSAVTIWVFDKQHHILVCEALDSDPTFVFRDSDLKVDEAIAHEQVRAAEVLMFADTDSCRIALPSDFDLEFISLPIFSRDVLRGALNLYNRRPQPWIFRTPQPAKNAVFLESLAGQMAVFIENRELELNTTFYKEVHHRVKNSLETVAGLLRMQIRRLDRITPEQALEDSISRVMTIALVHETLTQGETGFVDCAQLIGKIVGLLTAELPHRPETTLTITGNSPLILSREATSLALIANELVQNALSHGVHETEDGRIHIALHCGEGEIELTISDNGVGLPEGFNVSTSDSLGMTIVSTLVAEDLRGVFSLSNNPNGPGAAAQVRYRRAKIGIASAETAE